MICIGSLFHKQLIYNTIAKTAKTAAVWIWSNYYNLISSRREIGIELLFIWPLWRTESAILHVSCSFLCAHRHRKQRQNHLLAQGVIFSLETGKISVCLHFVSKECCWLREAHGHIRNPHGFYLQTAAMKQAILWLVQAQLPCTLQHSYSQVSFRFLTWFAAVLNSLSTLGCAETPFIYSHPLIHFAAYPGCEYSGSRLIGVFQASFPPAVLFSFSWGTPNVFPLQLDM